LTCLERRSKRRYILLWRKGCQRRVDW